MTDSAAVGLCFTCRWTRPSGNRRGSVFFRCARAERDPRFSRYPILPVRVCPGYEETMLFVVLLRYTAPVADEDAVRVDHGRYLAAAAGRGGVLAWARRESPPGEVWVCAAPGRARVEALVADDPYVRAGVAGAEIVPFDAAQVRGVLRTEPYFE